MAKAVIIGAGIGGLAAGVALHQRGWDVAVLERAPRLEPVGAGLSVAANALKALDVVGLGDRVRKLSRVQGVVAIRNSKGRYLSAAREDLAAARYGDSIVLLTRAALTDLLVKALPAGALRLGTEVLWVDPERGAAGTAGGLFEGDLLVAADGVNSMARRALFPEHPGPVHARATAWRALVTVPGRFEANESWGEGRVFGVMPMADDTVYLYATDRVPAGAVFADEKAELLKRFEHWHDPIPRLLELVEPGRLLRSDMFHLAKRLPALHRGRTVLLGDAAHPMTPNLGQGACQAIEDAVVLAADPEPSAYTAARLARTSRIVTLSAQIERTNALRNPVAVALRDNALAIASRISPQVVFRGLDPIFSWRPPTASSS